MDRGWAHEGLGALGLCCGDRQELDSWEEWEHSRGNDRHSSEPGKCRVSRKHILPCPPTGGLYTVASPFYR